MTTQLDSYSLEGTNPFEEALWKHKAVVSRAYRLLLVVLGVWLLFGNSGHPQNLHRLALALVPILGWDLLLRICAPRYMRWWMRRARGQFRPRSEAGRKILRISSVAISAVMFGTALWLALQAHIHCIFSLPSLRSPAFCSGQFRICARKAAAGASAGSERRERQGTGASSRHRAQDCSSHRGFPP